MHVIKRNVPFLEEIALKATNQKTFSQIKILINIKHISAGEKNRVLH